MKQDVFEWDDATQTIVEKAVENRELDNATENLKDQAEDSLDKNFHQFNFDEILRDRDTVVKSIQQVLSPRLNSFEKREKQIRDRKEESDFQANYKDNAVDTDDYDLLEANYELLKEIHSQTTIWAFVAHANSSDVAKALDIRQMQADQNEAMKMVNQNYDKFITAADKIGRQVKEGQKQALKEVLTEREEKIEAKDKRIEELERKIEEKKKSDVEDEPEPLTTRQRELVDLVNDNPEKGQDYFAEEMNLENRNISKLESDIQRKGYDFEIG